MMKEKRMLEGVYTDMQKKIFSKDWLRYNAPVLVCLAAILILIFLPTGFEGAVDYQGTERVRAEVLSVELDNCRHRPGAVGGTALPPPD